MSASDASAPRARRSPSHSVPVTIRLSGTEALIDVLERVRKSPARVLVIDCANHPMLRVQSLMRKLVSAAGTEMGKEVTFIFDRADQSGMTPRAAHRAATLRAVPQAVTAIPVRPRRATAHWYAVLLSGCAGALLVVVVLFVLPRASISIDAAVEPLSADLTVWLDAQLHAPDLSKVAYPAQFLERTELVEGDFPIQSEVELGNRAEGTAHLVNETASPQGIRGNTRLESNSGVILRTQRGVIVPPAGRAAVPVLAENGGERGNLEPQRLSLPGLPSGSQRVLYAEIVAPLRGGTTKIVRQLSDADVERGEHILREQVQKQLSGVIQSLRGGEGDSKSKPARMLEHAELARVTVTDRLLSVPVGTAAGTFHVKLRMKIEAMTVSEARLREFIRDVLRGRAGSGRDVTWDGKLDDLRIVAVRWAERRAESSLHLETQIVPALDRSDLIAQLAGQTAHDAGVFLRRLPGVRSASVVLAPRWVQRIPSNPRSVRIHIETSGSPAGK